MAFIETTANGIIIDQANAWNGYATMTNGYADGYGSEFALTFSGSQLTIGTGMLMQDGFRIINDELLTTNVGTNPTPVLKKIYLKIDMSTRLVTTVVDLATVTKTSDDLFVLSQNGIAYVEIGTFNLSTSGVTSASKTIKPTINKSRVVTLDEIGFVDATRTIDQLATYLVSLMPENSILNDEFANLQHPNAIITLRNATGETLVGNFSVELFKGTSETIANKIVIRGNKATEYIGIIKTGTSSWNFRSINPFVYDFVEQRNGRFWLSGQPIYEKVISISSLAAGAQSSNTVTGATAILFIKGYGTDTGGAKFQINYGNDTSVNNNLMAWSASAGNVSVRAGSGKSWGNIYLVVEYIK